MSYLVFLMSSQSNRVVLGFGIVVLLGVAVWLAAVGGRATDVANNGSNPAETSNLPSAPQSPGVDADGDGLADAWEWRFFKSYRYDGEDDPDGDGLTNADEHARGPAFRPNRKEVLREE